LTIKPHLLFCLTVSVGLSACVQTQPLQIPSGDQVSSGIKKFADSFNIFDQTGRQFRQLVADKNYSEAEALFDRAFYEYFEPRYAARPELIQEELGALAQASWDRNFSAQLEAVLPQVKAITDATNSQLWQTQTESLRRAQKLLAELSSNKLLSLTKHNVGSVSGLRVEVNRVSDLARKARPTSFPLTFEPVLENPKLKFAFFEQDFSPAEYRVSLEFQARALQTIFSNVGPQELKKKAVEFSDLLSPESKTQVDQRYFDLRRKELTDSKGKVPISRLALLAKVSDPPFRSNIDGFKNLVKVGFLDLTAESFRNRNVFDFEVEFNKDLEISLEDAKANLFSDKSWESYDFIFVTDLTFAKIKREFKDTQDRKSRFQAGVRQIPNPNYSGAIANYNKALADYNRALADSARQDACATPLACVFIAAAKAAVEGGARKNLETAQAGLSSTPQLLDEPVFQPYAYKEVSVSGNKTARVDYYVIDVREKRYFKSFFEYVDEERFDVVYNVHDNDPEKSRILSRLKTEDMVTAWEKKAPLIPLSQLFNLDNLQQGQSRKLVSLESFLAEFTNKRYASAAPVYST
jgi:serine protease Do